MLTFLVSKWFKADAEKVDRVAASSPHQLAELYDGIDLHRMAIQSGRLT